MNLRYWNEVKAAKTHICSVTGDLIPVKQNYYKRQIANSTIYCYTVSFFGYWLVSRYWKDDPSCWGKDTFVDARQLALKEFGSLDEARTYWQTSLKEVFIIKRPV